MRLRRSLFKWFWRQILPVTYVALPVMVLYVLLAREPLDWNDSWMGLFILVHSLALVVCLGRFQSTGFTFLYSRGFSRDALWGHAMLATGAAVLTIWLPVALLIWFRIRSGLQDVVMQSPYFPIMAPREMSAPWFWLGGYLILVSMFHYVWIRRAQPTRDSNGAVLLAVGAVIVIATLMSFRWHPGWFACLAVGLGAMGTVTALVGGLLLHRRLEVQGE